MTKLETVKNFFNDKRVVFPKNRSNEEEFILFIQENFKEYQQAIKELLFEKEIIDKTFYEMIIYSCSQIEQTIKYRLSGLPNKAYISLNNLINEGLYKTLFDYLTVNNSILVNPWLFRARISDAPLLNRKEMFHLCNKYRGQSPAYRFSLLGQPCLYLGSTIYDCWIELNKPSFSKLYISGFKYQGDVKKLVLDIGTIPKYITENLSEFENIDNSLYVKAYLLFWPLLFSCHIPTRNENRLFNEEYIIPQLLLEWVIDNKQFIGIRFHSTKVYHDYHPNASLFFQNYVFPVTDFTHEYDDSLSKMFTVTEPFHWETSFSLGAPVYGTEPLIVFYKSGKREISYPTTKFYRLEGMINEEGEFQTINIEKEPA
jgi:hypothetical protein